MQVPHNNPRGRVAAVAIALTTACTAGNGITNSTTTNASGTTADEATQTGADTGSDTDTYTGTGTGTDTGSDTDTDTGDTLDTSGESETDTGGPVCSEFETLVGEWAGIDPALVDCGVVGPQSSQQAWQHAHDCALEANALEQSFKLVMWLQGIDSQVGLAYVGVAGESYQLTQLQWDSDPCGGGGCGPAAVARSCADLVLLDGCAVEPPKACLACAGAGQADSLC
ncbi:hypothetical protein DB30_07166 [Enhygromyxa salina]|uniref:Uncharacterized protein n=1 Tax=Enhygromyxa salina TaxID=215803 RepID=A0A0C2DBN0_9BACT|nr:hypothetical protein [Enhygromyxa salina]KIG18830.1 hypothetical protein DB30_07166 [Enhygromyxa salina]